MKASNVSGGIRRWGSLGNFIDGDCVVAAFYHIVMAKHATHEGPLKRLAYLFGYRPPHSPFAIYEYAGYLATLGERPSPVQGVAVDGWLRWQQNLGHVTAWAQVLPVTALDPTGSTFEARIREAMGVCGGVILAGGLSNQAVREWGPGHIWDTRAGIPAEQSNPANGHAVAMLAYRAERDFAVTWGTWQTLTTSFRAACLPTAFVFLVADDAKIAGYDAKLAFVSGLGA